MSNLFNENALKLNPVVFKHLNNKDRLVQQQVIDLIKKYGDKDAISPLRDQLIKENNNNIRFNLLETIGVLDADLALKLSTDYLRESVSSDYAAAILILLTYGKSDDVQSAIIALHQLVQHSNPFLREKGAFIIRMSDFKEFEQDLIHLIADKDEHVSCTAVETIAKMSATPLIPYCLKHLTRRKIKTSARYLGAAAVPHILQEIPFNEDRSLLYALLASIPGNKAEEGLQSLLGEENTFSRFLLSKEINYRACVYGVSQKFKELTSKVILKEFENISFLNQLIIKHSDDRIQAEIRSRIKLSKQCFLQWIGIATDPLQINKLIPILMKSESVFPHQAEKEKALELLELNLHNHTLFSQVSIVFDPAQKQVPAEGLRKTFKASTVDQNINFNDPWLERVIDSAQNNHVDYPGKEMDSILKVFNLRKIELFNELPGEILLTIAEETESLSFNEGEVIFREGDVPDALYCICTGKVKFYRQGKELNCLDEYAFFGELGLIDGHLRSATAVADTDCVLLVLEKNTFDRMTEDLPEIMRSISKTILGYYRKHLAIFS